MLVLAYRFLMSVMIQEEESMRKEEKCKWSSVQCKLLCRVCQGTGAFLPLRRISAAKLLPVLLYLTDKWSSPGGQALAGWGSLKQLNCLFDAREHSMIGMDAGATSQLVMWYEQEQKQGHQ